MAAASQTMPMAQSPGLDALRGDPALSSSTDSFQLADYLDLGPSSSTSNTPKMAHAAPTPLPSSPSLTASSSRLSSKGAPAVGASPSDVTPPPPGSSSETVFRYYLKLELRKMGSPADDATIERYVSQHYGTFLKAMENGGKPPSDVAPSATTGVQNGNSQVVSTSEKAESKIKAPTAATDFASPSSTASKLRSESPSSFATSPESNVAPLSSVSPQPQPQPFKVPMPTLDAPMDSVCPDVFSTSAAENPAMFQTIDPHFVHYAGLNDPTSVPTHQIKQESDAMSEDGLFDTMEDSKDELTPLVSDLRFASSSEHSASRASCESDHSAFGNMERSESRDSEGPVSVPSSIRDSAAANLKPTPEEYRALSSKEKRQLRNKISARNFRERRKEYITHLEAQISDRDSIISSLRTQLSSMSLQNKKLEEDVKTLQARSLSPADVQKILEALQNAASNGASNGLAGVDGQAHGLRPSAPQDVTLSAVAASPAGVLSRPSTPSSPRPPFTRRSSPLPQHNPRKDISASGASASGSNNGGSFWQGGPTVAASA